MWNPKVLTINNFGPFESDIYNFNGPCLIEGDNKTDLSQETNGVGKSFFKESIRFAISGDLFKKNFPLIEVLREGQTEGGVVLELENSMTDMTLEIIRNFKLSSGKLSNKVLLLIDGEEERHSSIGEYNKRIIELIGISKEDLYTYYILSKKEFQSFFDVTNTGKQKIISRFSGIKSIDGIDSFIKKDLETAKEQKEEYERDIHSIEGGIFEIRESININSNKAFEENKLNSLLPLERSLKDKTNELKAFHQKESQIFQELQEYKTELEENERLLKIAEKNVDRNKFNEMRGFHIKIKAFLRKKEAELETNRKSKSKTEILLEKSIQCPSCKFEFILNKDVDLIEVKEYLTKLIEVIQGIELELEEGNTDLDKVKEDINSLQENIDKVTSLKEDKVKILESIEKHQTLKDTEKKINDDLTRLNLKIETIKEQKNTFDIKSQKKRVEDKLKEIVILQEQISKYDVKIQDYKMWLVYFKKFYSHLINKTLKTIEYQTNAFLEKMNSILGIHIEGYGINQDGSTKEEISILALKNNQKIGPFEKFSGGEESRCILANLIGYQQLINITSPSGGLNLLLLDEILGSVDSIGIQSIMEPLIKEQDRNVIVIDHIKHNLKEVPTLIIIKEKDIAQFITKN